MLKELPKKGDKVRYLGGHEDLTDDLTIGRDYVIEKVAKGFDEDKAIIIDDVGDSWEIFDHPDEYEMWELVEQRRVEAKLDNGATVTGSPDDVAAVIRNLEHKEFLEEIREENDLLPGDIAKWDNDLVEVIRHVDGGHAEVKMGVSRFVASIKNLTLVAAAETRLDREES